MWAFGNVMAEKSTDANLYCEELTNKSDVGPCEEHSNRNSGKGKDFTTSAGFNLFINQQHKDSIKNLLKVAANKLSTDNAETHNTVKTESGSRATECAQSHGADNAMTHQECNKVMNGVKMEDGANDTSTKVLLNGLPACREKRNVTDRDGRSIVASDTSDIEEDAIACAIDEFLLITNTSLGSDVDTHELVKTSSSSSPKSEDSLSKLKIQLCPKKDGYSGNVLDHVFVSNCAESSSESEAGSKCFFEKNASETGLKCDRGETNEVSEVSEVGEQLVRVKVGRTSDLNEKANGGIKCDETLSLYTDGSTRDSVANSDVCDRFSSEVSCNDKDTDVFTEFRVAESTVSSNGTGDTVIGYNENHTTEASLSKQTLGNIDDTYRTCGEFGGTLTDSGSDILNIDLDKEKEVCDDASVNKGVDNALKFDWRLVTNSSDNRTAGDESSMDSRGDALIMDLDEQKAATICGNKSVDADGNTPPEHLHISSETYTAPIETQSRCNDIPIDLADVSDDVNETKNVVHCLVNEIDNRVSHDEAIESPSETVVGKTDFDVHSAIGPDPISDDVIVNVHSLDSKANIIPVIKDDIVDQNHGDVDSVKEMEIDWDRKGVNDIHVRSSLQEMTTEDLNDTRTVTKNVAMLSNISGKNSSVVNETSGGASVRMCVDRDINECRVTKNERLKSCENLKPSTNDSVEGDVEMCPVKIKDRNFEASRDGRSDGSVCKTVLEQLLVQAMDDRTRKIYKQPDPDGVSLNETVPALEDYKGDVKAVLDAAVSEVGGGRVEIEDVKSEDNSLKRKLESVKDCSASVNIILDDAGVDVFVHDDQDVQNSQCSKKVKICENVCENRQSSDGLRNVTADISVAISATIDNQIDAVVRKIGKNVAIKRNDEETVDGSKKGSDVGNRKPRTDRFTGVRMCRNSATLSESHADAPDNLKINMLLSRLKNKGTAASVEHDSTRGANSVTPASKALRGVARKRGPGRPKRVPTENNSQKSAKLKSLAPYQVSCTVPKTPEKSPGSGVAQEGVYTPEKSSRRSIGVGASNLTVFTETELIDHMKSNLVEVLRPQCRALVESFTKKLKGIENLLQSERKLVDKLRNDITDLTRSLAKEKADKMALLKPKKDKWSQTTVPVSTSQAIQPTTIKAANIIIPKLYGAPPKRIVVMTSTAPNTPTLSTPVTTCESQVSPSGPASIRLHQMETVKTMLAAKRYTVTSSAPPLTAAFKLSATDPKLAYSILPPPHPLPPPSIVTKPATSIAKIIDLTSDEKHKSIKAASVGVPTSAQRIILTSLGNLAPANSIILRGALNPNGVSTLVTTVSSSVPASSTKPFQPSPAGLQTVVARMPVAMTNQLDLVKPVSLVLNNPPSQAKHPALLPDIPVQNLFVHNKIAPPKPLLNIARANHGIVLSWTLTITEAHSEISTYRIFAYQETTQAPSKDLWKKVGDVKAMPLPMACTLTQFQEGHKYHFSVQGLDVYQRLGLYSEPSTITLQAEV